MTCKTVALAPPLTGLTCGLQVIEGRFPGRRPSLTEQQREYIGTERSKGVSQRELAKLLEVSRWTI